MTSLPNEDRTQSTVFYIYGGLVAGAFVLSIIRAFAFSNALISSSANLHVRMLSAVLKAPVLFFDTNPVVRILNRFSGDISCMDEYLPETFLSAVQILLFSVGSVLLPCVLNPWIILGALPLAISFVVLTKYYLKTSRELKRLEAGNRSPVISHFSDTVEGLVTIKAYDRKEECLRELYK